MNKPNAQLTSTLLCLAFLMQGCEAPPPAARTLPPVVTLELPTAAGSQGPNLVADRTGTPVLSWVEPAGDAHALKYAVFESGAWGEVRTVVSGSEWFVNWADYPSVVPVDGDLWAAHWLQRRPAGGYAYDIRAVISRDAGVTWSAPFTPHTDMTDTEHGFVTIYPEPDGIGMVWLDGRNMVNEYDENDVGSSGMTLRSAVFAENGDALREQLVDGLICDCCQTAVTVTPGGPVAVYRNRTESEIRDIYLARQVEGQWQSGIPVGTDGWEIAGCPVNGPVIRSLDDSMGVAWFSAAGEQPKVQLVWSDDGGRTLSEPVLVAIGSVLGHVGAAMLPGGDMAVTWLAGSEGGVAELHVQRAKPDGSLGNDLVLEAASRIAPFSVPQVALAGDHLLLAWTDEAADERRVRTALVPLSRLD